MSRASFKFLSNTILIGMIELAIGIIMPKNKAIKMLVKLGFASKSICM